MNEKKNDVHQTASRYVSPQKYLAGWFLMAGSLLTLFALWMIRVDPYMHFHAPDTAHYYYMLNNERSQNDGIMRYFDYDAIITGTSMSENIHASKVDELFDCTAIKIPFSGASYKEINDNLERAVGYNHDVKLVIRALDYMRIIEDKDSMRFDMGVYPEYLYDNNPLNDVSYLWNREVFWNYVFPMSVVPEMEGFTPGITSFDDYANWQQVVDFGAAYVAPEGIAPVTAGEPVYLTDEEKKRVEDNITQNVTSFMKAHPDVTFYLFFTPYSAYWWRGLVEDGSIYGQIEAEEIAIRLILECENVRLFSYNTMRELTTDLDYYKDELHYAEDISNNMLEWMKHDQGRITAENMEAYLQEELDLYLDFEYESMNVYEQD